MSIEFNFEKSWMEELDNFISSWENEVEIIRQKSLDLDQCNTISEMFQKSSNGLLIRRPAGLSDEEIFSRLEQLDNKINSVLAMACCSEIKTTKRF